MTHYKGCVLNCNNGFRNATNSNFYRIPSDPDAPGIIIIMSCSARKTLSAFCHDFAVPPNNPLSFYSNKSYQFSARLICLFEHKILYLKI